VNNPRWLKEVSADSAREIAERWDDLQGEGPCLTEKEFEELVAGVASVVERLSQKWSTAERETP